MLISQRRVALHANDVFPSTKVTINGNSYAIIEGPVETVASREIELRKSLCVTGGCVRGCISAFVCVCVVFACVWVGAPVCVRVCARVSVCVHMCG